MNKENRSITISKIFTILFMAFLIATLIFAPRLVERLLVMSSNAYAAGAALFFITLFIGAVPAAAVLVSMYLLLHKMSSGEVFVRKNVTYLRFMSWCFYVGGLICMVSALYYAPWLPIGIASVFIGLVVRVVKSVIEKAVSLQDDADHTI
ncbi:MAG: DUF2975 domain-containing protein [Oscillospiraceae bacterium]|nr:DUF2975 domain-containing protein [Oscillospiraceae bacterium]